MKLYEAGRAVDPLFELVRANVRTPDEVLGDLHSQVVGNEVGGRQLLGFLDEFGLEDIESLADEIIGRSEAAMRARIRALPDGAYPFELVIDGFAEPIVIRTRVEVRGDALAVDYTGSSGAVNLGVNVCLNYTRAYTTYGIKCVISPDVPNNEGSFRPVSVHAPEGSILNARFPAAVAGRHLVGHFLPSAVMGALAGLLPDRVMAPGYDGLWDTQVSGEERATGRYFSYTWFSAGGAGALADKDGLSATSYPSGVAGVPVEVMESIAPVVIRRRELRRDSGGPGRFRGGLGQTMEIEVLADREYLFSGLYERIRHPAPGLQGGGPGAPGRLSTDNGADVQPKISRLVPADTVVTIELPGGGGHGDPYERDPARVQEDARQGYVSRERAEEDYGVVLDPGTLTVMREETERLRRRRPDGEGGG
jgi:N-methylhydantoinase B